MIDRLAAVGKVPKPEGSENYVLDDTPVGLTEVPTPPIYLNNYYALNSYIIFHKHN